MMNGQIDPAFETYMHLGQERAELHYASLQSVSDVARNAMFHSHMNKRAQRWLDAVQAAQTAPKIVQARQPILLPGPGDE